MLAFRLQFRFKSKARSKHENGVTETFVLPVFPGDTL